MHSWRIDMEEAVRRLKGRQKMYRALSARLFDEGSLKMARAWRQRADGLQEAIEILEEMENGKGETDNGKRSV